MMPGSNLLTYCLISGAVYLLIIDLIWSKLETFVPTLHNFPKSLIDPKNLSWFVYSFIIEFVFFVLMPSVIYNWFYPVMPLSGVRGGAAAGLLFFMFGMVPFAALLLFRIRIPVVFLLYQLLGLFIKIVGVLMIIGYLYSL
jgi:hypothetical protein